MASAATATVVAQRQPRRCGKSRLVQQRQPLSWGRDSFDSHCRGAEISLTATVVAQVDRRIASMGWIEGSLGHVQCDGCSRVTKDRFAGKHPATKGDALHLPPIVSSPPAVAGRRRKSRREQPAATGKKHERVRTPQRRVEKRRNVMKEGP